MPSKKKFRRILLFSYILSGILIHITLGSHGLLKNQVLAQTLETNQPPKNQQSQNSTQDSSAKEQFSTTLETTYIVAENGYTKVSHAFTITNLQPLFSVTQYALQISSPTITNISVKNGQNKDIPFLAVATDVHTSIAITFPDQIVGQGKQRIFTISFTDLDASIISGQVLEVAVPKIKDPQMYSKYTVSLITPIRFGSANKVNPEKYTTTITEQGVKTSFSENHFTGVNAIFGTEQTFDLSLKYHLSNPSSTVRLAQIALPPDTSYQRMIYSQLDPLPQEIEQDIDGNWIATYRIPATTTMTVLAKLKANLTMEPNPEVLVTPPTAIHTKGTEYWPINSDIIKKTAEKYTTAQDIYTFTAENLSYDYSLLTKDPVRLGADKVLANPLQALCQEFTDVFIALARKNNIPARRLTGYAHTENTQLRPLSLVDDVLHAWPEYYNQEKKLWIPVDPTWASTSGGINYFDQLDLNHIVFTINGESSQRPYPAGSYKTAQAQGKDVEVSFGAKPLVPEPNYTISFSKPMLGLAPFLRQPYITIENISGAAQYSQILTLSVISGTKDDVSSEILLWPQNEIIIPSFPPFQKRDFSSIALQKGSIFPTQGTIQVTYGETSSQFTIPIYPYFWRWLFNPFFVLGLVGGCIFLTLIAGSVLVLRRRK